MNVVVGILLLGLTAMLAVSSYGRAGTVHQSDIPSISTANKITE